VEGVATASLVPLGGSDTSSSFSVVGNPPAKPSEAPDAGVRSVSSGYFAVMGIPLLQGRLPSDVENGARELVVNAELARRYLGGGREAIGKLVNYMGEPAWQVVGVVGDVRHDAPREAPRPEMYLPYTQVESDDMLLVVRSGLAAASLTRALRSELAQIDPSVAVDDVRTMGQRLTSALSWDDSIARLLSALSAVALALASIGLYGVISYAVRQRRRELGIRAALGASRRSLVRLVLSSAARLTVAGLFIGGALAWVMARILSSVLYGVSASDPWIAAFSAAILAGVALFASYLPARLASRADPNTALRGE
jgi:predicted permease